MAYENMYKRPLKHHVAISVVNNDRYQAVCNPIRCGWKGSVTIDRSTAEFEREIHYIEILDLDTGQFPQ
jgi:hypothetical protein